MPKKVQVAWAALLALAALSGCGTISSHDEKTTGSPPLCAPGVQLGKVVVAPLTHWRPDQKEPPVREGIAHAAIEQAFAGLPCASSVEILPFQPDRQAQSVASEASKSGGQTLVTITVHELGPIVLVSFPVLWSGWSDVAFDFDAIDLGSGNSRLAVSRHRKVGGAFELRGLGPLQGEFEKALKPLLTTP